MENADGITIPRWFGTVSTLKWQLRWCIEINLRSCFLLDLHGFDYYEAVFDHLLNEDCYRQELHIGTCGGISFSWTVEFLDRTFKVSDGFFNQIERSRVFLIRRLRGDVGIAWLLVHPLKWKPYTLLKNICWHPSSGTRCESLHHKIKSFIQLNISWTFSWHYSQKQAYVPSRMAIPRPNA